jgi:predicted amidohydrolase
MSRLTVAAVQTSPTFGEVAANVAAALAAVPAACDLAVLPELFSTGYQFRSRDEAFQLAETFPDGPACTALRERAADSGTTLVAGLCERDGERLYNSALLARPDGSWERYRKVHLFWDEKEIFAPGDLGFAVHEACGIGVGMLICFDWIFPEAARTLALAGAVLLAHPANLVLPHCPRSMPVRCLENRVYAVTADRVGREQRTAMPLVFIGRSQVISPEGERLAGCDGEHPGVAVAEIDPARTDKQVTPRNHLWRDRRPDLYRL